MHTSRNNNARLKESGFSLIEVMMTLLIFGVVLAVVNQVFFASQNLYSTTAQRADQQMSARSGMGVLVNELRMAGCDPTEVGIGGLLQADEDSLHFQFDRDGDGAISTAEPSEDVLYFFQAASQALFRDPGTGAQLMIADVSGVTLAYFDENDQPLGPLPLSLVQRALVRSIGLSITTNTPRGGEVEAATRVALRNLI